MELENFRETKSYFFVKDCELQRQKKRVSVNEGRRCEAIRSDSIKGKRGVREKGYFCGVREKGKRVRFGVFLTIPGKRGERSRKRRTCAVKGERRSRDLGEGEIRFHIGERLNQQEKCIGNQVTEKMRLRNLTQKRERCCPSGNPSRG